MPTPADRPLGLRERKKARTRATIQDHALRLFRTQGYRETTIEQIINAAEVSATTLFRYFPTKEDLVLQDDFDPVILSALRQQPDELLPIQALRAAFREFFAQVTAEQRAAMHERLRLVTTVPTLRAAMFDQYAQTMESLAGVLGARQGRAPASLEVRTAAGAAMGAMMASVATIATNPSLDLSEVLDEAFGHLEQLGDP